MGPALPLSIASCHHSLAFLLLFLHFVISASLPVIVGDWLVSAPTPRADGAIYHYQASASEHEGQWVAVPLPTGMKEGYAVVFLSDQLLAHSTDGWVEWLSHPDGDGAWFTTSAPQFLRPTEQGASESLDAHSVPGRRQLLAMTATATTTDTPSVTQTSTMSESSSVTPSATMHQTATSTTTGTAQVKPMSPSPSPSDHAPSPLPSPFTASIPHPSPVIPSESPTDSSSPFSSPSPVEDSSSPSSSPSPQTLLFEEAISPTPSTSDLPSLSPSTSPSPSPSPPHIHTPTPTATFTATTSATVLPTKTQTDTSTTNVTRTSTPGETHSSTITITSTATTYCDCCHLCGLNQKLHVSLPTVIAQPTRTALVLQPSVIMPTGCIAAPIYHWQATPSIGTIIAQSTSPGLTIPPNVLDPTVIYNVVVQVVACGMGDTATTSLLYVAPPQLRSSPALVVTVNSDMASVQAGDWAGSGVLQYSFGYEVPSQPPLVLIGPTISRTVALYLPYLRDPQNITLFVTVTDNLGTSQGRVSVFVDALPQLPSSSAIQSLINSTSLTDCLRAAQLLALSDPSTQTRAQVDRLLGQLASTPVDDMASPALDVLAAIALSLSSWRNRLTMYALQTLGTLAKQIASAPATSTDAAQAMLLTISNLFYAVTNSQSMMNHKFLPLALTISDARQSLWAVTAKTYASLPPGQTRSYETSFVNIALCRYPDLYLRNPNRVCLIDTVSVQVLAISLDRQEAADVLVEVYKLNPISSMPSMYSVVIGRIIGVSANQMDGSPAGTSDDWPAVRLALPYDNLQLGPNQTVQVAVYSDGLWSNTTRLDLNGTHIMVQASRYGLFVPYRVEGTGLPIYHNCVVTPPPAIYAPEECDCMTWIILFIIFIILFSILAAVILVLFLICPYRLRGRRTPYTDSQQDAMAMAILEESHDKSSKHSAPSVYSGAHGMGRVPSHSESQQYDAAKSTNAQLQVPITDDPRLYGAEPPYVQSNFGPPVKAVSQYQFPEEDHEGYYMSRLEAPSSSYYYAKPAPK